MTTRETRAFPFDVRTTTEEGDALTIEGYVMAFGEVADIGGYFDETFNRGSFAKTLRENDQLAVYNHDASETLARKSAGTLELREDEHGLFMRAVLDRNITSQRDTYLRIKRGDVKGMSVGFKAIKDVWQKRDGKNDLREVTEARLWEVSPTAFPAYDMTEVQARSLLATAHSATTERAGGEATPTTPTAGAEIDSTTDEPITNHSTAGLQRIALLRRKLDLALTQ
jgi:hypothetical protein